MQTNDEPMEESAQTLPLLMAAELQDNLLTATNDLDRLQRLLLDACESLMGHFYKANHHLGVILHQGAHYPNIDTHDLHTAMENITHAVTALQFQDMASQLIHHTNRRLRNCADQLAREAMGSDPDGEAIVEEAPLRPNPVTQDEMDAGSVELF